MATTVIELPFNTWIRVNNTSDKGIIELRVGKRILFTQQSVDPNTLIGRIGFNGELTDKTTKQWYDTSKEPNEHIWAMSVSENGEIDVTPVGGVL